MTGTVISRVFQKIKIFAVKEHYPAWALYMFTDTQKKIWGIFEVNSGSASPFKFSTFFTKLLFFTT